MVLSTENLWKNFSIMENCANTNKRKIYWSDSEFIKVVKDCYSISEVLRYFNLAEQQPHYRKRFYYDVQRLGIDLSHMGEHIVKLAQKPNDGKAIVSTTGLKEKLLKNGTEYKCSIPECGLPGEWLGKKLSLHLDHIDGNRKNNNLENLRFICPNCHSQTDTYTNKNVKDRSWHISQRNPKNCCIDCGNFRKGLAGKTNRCMKCHRLHISIDWPDINLIIEKVKNASTFISVANDLQVSEKSLRDRLKKFGFDPKKIRNS